MPLFCLLRPTTRRGDREIIFIFFAPSVCLFVSFVSQELLLAFSFSLFPQRRDTWAKGKKILLLSFSLHMKDRAWDVKKKRLQQISPILFVVVLLNIEWWFFFTFFLRISELLSLNFATLVILDFFSDSSPLPKPKWSVWMSLGYLSRKVINSLVLLSSSSSTYTCTPSVTTFSCSSWCIKESLAAEWVFFSQVLINEIRANLHLTFFFQKRQKKIYNFFALFERLVGAQKRKKISCFFLPSSPPLGGKQAGEKWFSTLTAKRHLGTKDIKLMGDPKCF